MTGSAFITAKEIADELGISMAYAYKVVRTLNAELKQQGYSVIRGKVSRKYFEKKYYYSDGGDE